MGLKIVKPFRGGNNFNWSEFKDEVESSPNQKAFADVWGLKGDRGPAQWGWDYFHGNWGRWMRSPKKLRFCSIGKVANYVESNASK